MKVFAAPVKRFGPKNFRLRSWNGFAETLAVPLGLRSTNSVRPRRRNIDSARMVAVYYRELPACKRIVQSWDTAFKAGSQSDYSVCSTWGVLEKGYYLLSLWRGRVDFPELKRLVGSLGREWNPSAILVEDAASGQSLIQELRHESSLPIIAAKIDRDKIKGTVDNAVDRSRGRFSLRSPHPGLLTL